MAAERNQARDAIRAQVEAVPGIWTPIFFANIDDPAKTKPDAGTTGKYIEEQPVGSTSSDAARDGTPTGRWRRHIAQIQLMLVNAKGTGYKVFEDMADAIEARLLAASMALSSGEPVTIDDVSVGGIRNEDGRAKVPVVITFQYTAH